MKKHTEKTTKMYLNEAYPAYEHKQNKLVNSKCLLPSPLEVRAIYHQRVTKLLVKRWCPHTVMGMARHIITFQQFFFASLLG